MCIVRACVKGVEIDPFKPFDFEVVVEVRNE